MSQTSDQVRRAFLDFFVAREHELVPSGPVVIPNDPTLMFANAGMVQFKDVFTGQDKRSYQRATTSQKCIRISGKHNDLENVGPSPRHHTFFEMLGNFSFGDYFKEEAIVHAWDFIQQLGLAKDRLVVTYFGGEDGIAPDEAARELWRKVSGLGDDRIIACGASENFWSMGDTGACGPCSEIHYFLGPNPDPATFGEEQTPDGFGWMEIWNLVFMQFERGAGGKLSDLPRPSIDTGMGLERIACILQGKTNNYETDILRGLVDTVADVAGKPYGSSMANDDVSMRVIADHARLTAFMLAEGVMPDTNGRQYVLRRVMRRAIRHGHRLGIARPFLHEVALRVTELMGHQYPELVEKAQHVATVAEQEEVRFRRTIERGLVLLDERCQELGGADSDTLDGADAFKLYDTYGFPLDLTEVICAERGLKVDSEGYERAMAEARGRSEFKGVEQAVEGVYREVLERVSGGEVAFSGYDRNSDSSEIVALLVGGELVESVDANSGAVELITLRTPFYGEAGGQLGDQGRIEGEAGAFEVEDTQKPLAGLVVHRGQIAEGQLRVGQDVRLTLDVARREGIRRNHSATHLLHWALREVVGKHAQQKGSWVGPERLRFDFTHGQAVTEQELARIEDLVNGAIVANASVTTELLPIEDAKQRGAMMLFGEKYGEAVRVLTMGHSVELCGGTHARATGDIGLLKIVAEQGVAAGVRRITATSGQGAMDYFRQLEQSLMKSAELARSAPLELPAKLAKLVASEKQQEKKIKELQGQIARGGGQVGGGLEGMLARARLIDGVHVLASRTELGDRAALRELAEQLRDKLGEAIVLLGSVDEGKAQLVLTIAKPLTKRYMAGKLIKPIAEAVGGSGGGRPDMAQAGGTQPEGLDGALELLYQIVSDAH